MCAVLEDRVRYVLRTGWAVAEVMVDVFMSADYIFVLNPPNKEVSVVGLAQPFAEKALAPGLPRMGVCGSDHISLAADLHWPPLQ